MRSNESMEDYLEWVLRLEKSRQRIRAVDLAKALGYTRPSVSHAVKRLEEEGCLEKSGGSLTLTAKGRRIAEATYERHVTLSDWFASLGVSKEKAALDACRIEHVISEESYEAWKRHIRDDHKSQVK